MATKLLTLRAIDRPKSAGRARLLQACRASGLNQLELGRLIDTDDRGVRRLLRRDRKRADRLDLLCAVEALAVRKKAA